MLVCFVKIYEKMYKIIKLQTSGQYGMTSNRTTTSQVRRHALTISLVYVKRITKKRLLKMLSKDFGIKREFMVVRQRALWVRLSCSMEIEI